jgi:hypothetical protein
MPGTVFSLKAVATFSETSVFFRKEVKWLILRLFNDLASTTEVTYVSNEMVK